MREGEKERETRIGGRYALRRGVDEYEMVAGCIRSEVRV